MSSLKAIVVASTLMVTMTACAGQERVTPESEPESVAAEAPSEPVPSHAWPLDGDGEPAAGNAALIFDGAVGLAGGAAAFDGASGFARTTTPGPLDTIASFTVAAWVSLHSPTLEGGAEYVTAVSQLGDVAAAFYLGVGEGN